MKTYHNRKKYRNRRIRIRTRKGGNQQKLIVRYGSINVSGQELKKEDTQIQPYVNFSSVSGKLYTIVMWDPDVPQESQPGFVHWIITNIQSPKNIGSNIILQYKGPSPPFGTHRYYFGLFEQISGKVSISITHRANFSIKDFIDENKLKEIGNVFMKVSY